MMPQVRILADKVRLLSVETDRFKTGRIAVSMALPMDEKMAANSLLIYLLKRSCKDYPDFRFSTASLTSFTAQAFRRVFQSRARLRCSRFRSPALMTALP